MNSSSARKEKILVVEDEAEIRKVCHRALTSQGYCVDFAANGAIAEDMLMKKDYDLLIIDIKTPVIDGKQFYQYLENRYPKLPNRVIFTTGDVASNNTQGFLRQTGRPFLLKPFTPDELKAIVRETLEQLD